MKNYFEILKDCPLFTGIDEARLETLLRCLGVTEKRVPKGGFVFAAGDAVTAVGIVLQGEVHVMQEDFWGNRAILANIGPGGLFGEALSFSGQARFPVGVYAVQDTVAMLLDGRRIITTCPSACGFHSKLIQNLLKILAGKNVMLTGKMDVLTRRTTREKLLAYLSREARAAGSSSFTIPFDRQALADYLAVDRSAMSAELSKMRREGLIAFRRNAFELL